MKQHLGQTLMDQLWEFQQQGLFCDAEIQTKEGAILTAHANLLAARSPFLNNLFAGKPLCKIRFVLNQPVSVLTDALEIIYTGKLSGERCIDKPTSVVLDKLDVCYVGRKIFKKTRINGKVNHDTSTINERDFRATVVKHSRDDDEQCFADNLVGEDKRFHTSLGEDDEISCVTHLGVAGGEGKDEPCVTMVTEDEEETFEDDHCIVDGKDKFQQFGSTDQHDEVTVSLDHDHLYSKLCEYCGFKIETKEQYAWHKLHKCLGDEAVTEDKIIFKCYICSHVITEQTSEDLYKHMQEHDLLSSAKLKCSYCHKLFASKLGFSRHIGNCTDGVKKWFTCDCCGKHLKTLKNLDAHKQKLHNNSLPISKNAIGDQGKKCSYCEMIFFDYKALAEHKKTHRGPLLYSCTECKEDFKLHVEFLRHRADHHQEGFMCQICGKYFALAVRRDKHKQAVHDGDKSHMCHVCGLAFSESALLKRHMKTAHSELRPFKCNYCNASFKRRDNLKQHLARHDSTGTMYKCSFCDRVYSNEQRRMRHEFDHTGKKCQICDVVFYGYLKYIKHRSKDHSDVSKRRQLVRPVNVNKKYACLFCNELFNSSDKKYRHQKTHMGFKQGSH